MSEEVSAMRDELRKPSLVAEFWHFVKHEKKWWMGVSAFVVVLLSAFIVMADDPSMIPIIYRFF